jgi:hypothetical protein
MTFRKTVLAYLTGFLIVQPLWSRLHRAWVRREMVDPSPEHAANMRMQGRFIVDEMNARFALDVQPVPGRFDEEQMRAALEYAVTLAWEPHEETAPAMTIGGIVDYVMRSMEGEPEPEPMS